MADKFTVDTAEVEQLAADLGDIGRNAGQYVRKAVEVTARKIRDDWRADATGMAHAPAYPYSITYDLSTLALFGVTVLQAEIGPDKERPQGALGNLLEFGSINNPPQGQGQTALDKNEADFAKGLSMALETGERQDGWGL